MHGILLAATHAPVHTVTNAPVPIDHDQGWAHDLWIAVLAAIIAAIPAAILVLIYQQVTFRVRLRKLAGSYTVNHKESRDLEQERPRITVERGYLRVVYEELDTGQSVVGSITMEEPLLTTGRGHYMHDDDGTTLWGSWDVQAPRPGLLLVHATFLDTETHLLSVNAYEWNLVPV